MANILDKYPDSVNEVAIPTTESTIKTKAKKQRHFNKKEKRALKALTNALRNHNMLMEQEAARRKAEGEAAERATAEKADVKRTDKGKSNTGVKGFFSKLGDAICKAVPKVLTTLATLAFGFFVKTKFTGKSLQAV